MPRCARLVATGSCLRRRWWAPDDWAASDLAVRAGRQALAAAGRDPEDVDLIVLGTGWGTVFLV